MDPSKIVGFVRRVDEVTGSIRNFLIGVTKQESKQIIALQIIFVLALLYLLFMIIAVYKRWI